LEIFPKLNLNTSSNQNGLGETTDEQELHKNIFKEWRIPKDLLLDNVIG